MSITSFLDRAVKLCAGSGRNRKLCAAVDQAQALANARVKQSARRDETMQVQKSSREAVTTQCAEALSQQRTVRHGFSPVVERAHIAAFLRHVLSTPLKQEDASSLPEPESRDCIFPFTKAPILLPTTSSSFVPATSISRPNIARSHTESTIVGFGRYRHPANATCEWLERRKSQEEQMLGCQKLFGQPGFERILGPHPFDEEIAQHTKLSRVNTNDSTLSSTSTTTTSISESFYDEETLTLITRGFDSSLASSPASAEYWLQGVGRGRVRVKRVNIMSEEDDERLQIRANRAGGHETVRRRSTRSSHQAQSVIHNLDGAVEHHMPEHHFHRVQHVQFNVHDIEKDQSKQNASSRRVSFCHAAEDNESAIASDSDDDEPMEQPQIRRQAQKRRSRSPYPSSTRHDSAMSIDQEQAEAMWAFEFHRAIDEQWMKLYGGKRFNYYGISISSDGDLGSDDEVDEILDAWDTPVCRRAATPPMKIQTNQRRERHFNGPLQLPQEGDVWGAYNVI